MIGNKILNGNINFKFEENEQELEVLNVKKLVKVIDKNDSIHLMDFCSAFKYFANGKYIARQKWKDYYINKVNDKNQLIIADIKRFGFIVWIPTLEDFTTKDWFVI